MSDPTFEVEETAVRVAQEQDISYAEALHQVQRPMTRTEVDAAIEELEGNLP